MVEAVPSDLIEGLVGARRHPHQHLGRAVSADQVVYILHSQRCVDSGVDLQDCPWSEALDRGINVDDWQGPGYEDRVVVLAIIKGRLFPIVTNWLDDFILEGS